MIENMLLAEAVVPRTLGAVAELHTGIILIGDAADGTLMEIAPPLAQLLLCLLEVDGLGGGLVPPPGLGPAQSVRHVLPEEDEEVGQGQHRRQQKGDGSPKIPSPGFLLS